MSKRVPVYLSEEELKEILVKLRKVPHQTKLTDKEKLALEEKIKETLQTFEET